MFGKKKKKYHAPQITDQNFDEIVRTSKVPVLLDFYADWCGPCKILGPIIDEIAKDYEGKALVAKIDTGRNPMLSQKFKIKSIPTLLFINNQMVLEQINGLVPKQNLEHILDEYIEICKTDS